jgi:hypothetical protein
VDKYIVVDSDTIIIKSCMSVQTNLSVYKDDQFICGAKSIKQWCIENGTKDAEGNVTPASTDGYEFRKEARLVTNSPENILVARCKAQITKAFKEIQDKYPDRKMIIVLEAENNFREDYYPQYKQQRDGEIILRKKLSKWVGTHFKNVQFAFGQETDDIVAIYMWKGYRDKLKTGEYTYVISSCDKDLRTVAGKLYNYCDNTEQEISELEADRWFCTQVLYGDNIDNVQGIGKPLSKALCQKYGVRPNTRGVGETTAVGIMASCESSKECFERLVECYKDAWGDEWLDRLKFESFPLRMRHVPNEMYDITKHMDHLGVVY